MALTIRAAWWSGIFVNFVDALKAPTIRGPFALDPAATTAIVTLIQRAVIAADKNGAIFGAAMLRLHDNNTALRTGLLRIGRAGQPGEGRGGGKEQHGTHQIILPGGTARLRASDNGYHLVSK